MKHIIKDIKIKPFAECNSGGPDNKKLLSRTCSENIRFDYQRKQRLVRALASTHELDLSLTFGRSKIGAKAKKNHNFLTIINLAINFKLNDPN
jgi:hypothetical protein